MSVPPYPDTSPPPHRAPFAMPPHEVMRDPTLSVDAKVIWTLLDGHAGENYSTRVRQQTLAQEMGLGPSSLRRVKRAVAELVERGLLLVERTGRSNVYQVLNPSRMTHPERLRQRLEHAEKQQKRQTVSNPAPSDRAAVTLSDRAAVSPLHKKNPSKNKQSKEEPQRDREPVAVAEVAAAAGSAMQKNSTADPFAVETLLTALPDHLRPEPTANVAEALAAAVARGWTPEHLAAAIADQIPNPTAGPGLAVKILRDLSAQPPAEHLRRKQKPTWCGTCDEISRLVEIAGGKMKRCSACHPLAEHQEQPAAEISSLNSEELHSNSERAEMILADLRARRGSQSGTAALMDELALAEPSEALTAALSGSGAAAQAVSA